MGLCEASGFSIFTFSSASNRNQHYIREVSMGLCEASDFSIFTFSAANHTLPTLLTGLASQNQPRVPREQLGSRERRQTI